MALRQDYEAMAAKLTKLLGLSITPIGITFSDSEPPPVARISSEAPAPTPDGRSGAVPAGCVFWIKGADATFSTTAEDHGNCSVGSVTHGFKRLPDVASNTDVKALVESGWVSLKAMQNVTTVSKAPRYVVYGPLMDTPVDPDIVLLRVNAKQAMILHEAVPELRFEGKPQCHIVAIAKELGHPALSTGCMLSRVRTGMSNNELTCALPVQVLPEIIERLQEARSADDSVAAYAAEDTKRFG